MCAMRACMYTKSSILYTWKLEMRHFVFIIIVIVVVACLRMRVCAEFMHWKMVETTYCQEKFHRFFLFLVPSLSLSLSYSNNAWYAYGVHRRFVFSFFFHLICHLVALNVFIFQKIKIYDAVGMVWHAVTSQCMGIHDKHIVRISNGYR